jgi:hypothetical protein
MGKTFKIAYQLMLGAEVYDICWQNPVAVIVCADHAKVRTVDKIKKRFSFVTDDPTQ